MSAREMVFSNHEVPAEIQPGMFYLLESGAPTCRPPTHDEKLARAREYLVSRGLMRPTMRQAPEPMPTPAGSPELRPGQLAAYEDSRSRTAWVATNGL